MSDNWVSLLTPPGTGAIATVEVAGPQAWSRVRELFVGKLSETPELHRFWYGKFAGDDVILAVKRVEPEPVIEIHCHGGRRVVQEVMAACGFAVRECAKPQAALATTLRTASILLDQQCGAFRRAVKSILDSHDFEKLAELASFADFGEHLTKPWKVVVAGAPNVGKSSLVNALAGYQRSVVSPTPGTTRDVVTVQLAFDGWPVEVADTAGIREAAGLEAEGIEKAVSHLAETDLVLWVLDSTDPNARPIPSEDPDRAMSEQLGPVSERIAWEHKPFLTVVNKCDLPAAGEMPRDAIRISAKTGEGSPALVAAIARKLVPVSPGPGTAVPYTADLTAFIKAAHVAVQICGEGEWNRTTEFFLRTCLEQCS